jgi:hypothetical protein
MIPLVEDIISEAIDERLKFLKSNVDILDRIFSSASVTTRNKLKEYISNNSIKVIRGYPVTQAQLPSYCIMLGGEQEQTGGLNNFLAENTDDFETASFTETIPIDPKTGIFQLTHKPLVNIDSFTYEGQTYTGDYASVIDFNKSIAKLAGSDLVDVTISVTYTYKTTGYNLYGTMYHSQYRVESWTTNGDLTVILYHLLKWMFLTKRQYFSSQNLFIQNLGGLDFEPAPEYFPEFVFRRALTFECTTDASYDEAYTYIEGITDNGAISG